MAIYNMQISGEYYHVDTEGRIKRLGIKGFGFSNTWTVYGVAERWNSHPVPWNIIKKHLNTGATVTGYLYDVDHGTVRMWGGKYAGKLPKVTIWK